MLLVVGLLSNAPATARLDAEASAVTLRELQRDLRHARELSAALAKAVRELVVGVQVNYAPPRQACTFADMEDSASAAPLAPGLFRVKPAEYSARLMNLPPPAAG